MASQRFSYRNADVLFNAIHVLGFSLLWNGLLGWMLVRVPFDWPALVVALVFGGIGVAIFVYSIARLLTFFNEAITITDTELTWVNRFGREVMRVKVSELIKGSLSTGSMKVDVGEEVPGKLYSIDSIRGTIHFGSNISNAQQLVRTLTDLTGQPHPRGVFNYRSPLLAIVPLIFIPMILAATISMTVAAFTTGVPMTMNGRPSGMMPWYAVVGMDLAFWAFLIPLSAFALAFWNEQIKVTNAEVIWRDRYGNERIRVPLSDVEYGRVRRIGYTNGGCTYVVQTKAGEIRFTNALRNAEALAMMFERPARATGAPDPWINDPLHQPDTTASGS